MTELSPDLKQALLEDLECAKKAQEGTALNKGATVKDLGKRVFMRFLEEPMPEIVCLCGSTKFPEAFAQANLRETLKGNIVLTVGCMTHSDEQLKINEEQKRKLDALHFRKIELADRVLVLNVGGYIGESTANELVYAFKNGKEIEFLEPGNYSFSVPDHLASEVVKMLGTVALTDTQ